MGGAHAVAALAYGTESDRARRRHRRPGRALRAGGQAPGLRRRRHRQVRRAERRARRSPTARPTPSSSSPTCSPRPSTAPARSSRSSPTTRRCWTPQRTRLRGGAEGDGGPPRCVVAATIDAALAVAEASRPSTCELVGARAEALAPRVRAAGCVFVGRDSGTAFGDYVAGSNHTLPTGGAARFASALSPRAFRRRMTEVRIGAAAADALAHGRRADRARPRDSPQHAASMAAARECRDDEPHGRDRTGQTKETDVTLRARRSTAPARARARRASASSITCSTCWRATAGWTSRSRSPATSQTGAHHTVEDTGHRARPGARPGARRPRRHLPLRPRCRADGRGARGVRRSTSPAGRSSRFEADLPPGGDRRLRPRADRGVLPRRRQHREADAAPHGRGGHQRPPHDRGGVQGVRAGAAPGRGDRPDRDGRAVDEGHADRVTTAIGIVDYGMGNRRSVEKALERVGATAAADRRPRRAARRRRACRARRRRVPRGDATRSTSAASTSSIRERAAAGRAGARVVPRHAAAVRGLRGVRRRRGARAAARATSCALDARGLKLPHIGWNEVRCRARPSARATACPSPTAFYHVHSFARDAVDDDDRARRQATTAASSRPSSAAATSSAASSTPRSPRARPRAAANFVGAVREGARVILYPAIDISEGKAVRLVKGDFDQVTVYEDSPLEAARAWVDAGRALPARRRPRRRRAAARRRIARSTSSGSPTSCTCRCSTAAACARCRRARRAARRRRARDPRHRGVHRHRLPRRRARRVPRADHRRRRHARRQRLDVRLAGDDADARRGASSSGCRTAACARSSTPTSTSDGMLEGLDLDEVKRIAERRPRALPLLRRHRHARGPARAARRCARSTSAA